jgi:S-methylmethionine-dependent homocysteine/selenocysteine methylase
MSPQEAAEYHLPQIKVFQDSETDIISAMTLTYPDEAIGIVRAAKICEMPVVISFTLEIDGKLPSGHTLKEAIQIVDEATDKGPAYYLVNCCYPTHFKEALRSQGDAEEAAKTEGMGWLKRIKGIRSNSSKKSHDELNEATELDEGDPEDIGQECVSIRNLLPTTNVFGGCCGTTTKHMEAIGMAFK